MQYTKATIELMKAQAREVALANMSKTVTPGLRKSSNAPLEFDGKKDLMLSKMIAVQLGFDTKEDCSLEKKFLKTLTIADGAAAGVLITPEISTDIIARLHDKAVVRNMPGVRTRPLGDGKLLTNPAQTAGPTITYGDEAEEIDEDTTLQFGENDARTHKGTCLIKESREFFENAGANVEDLLRDQVAQAMAEDEDKQVLQGVGGKAPLGIYYHPGVLNTTLNATPTFDDFVAAETQVQLNKGMISGYVMSPYTIQTLRTLKDGLGRYIWNTQNMIGSTGVPQTSSTLNGLPASTTTQVGTTGFSGASESYIIGGQWDQLTMLESPNGMRFEQTREGADTFEKDLVALKFVRYLGYYLRHPELFAVIGDVKR